MCGADDVRKGYKGCFGDGDGPYQSWGFSRTLPATLSATGFTHEQCAQAAALAGHEVYALQVEGVCFMGALTDVAQMKTKLDDSVCSTTPCSGLGAVGCVGLVNKVYAIGGPYNVFVYSRHLWSCIYLAGSIVAGCPRKCTEPLCVCWGGGGGGVLCVS
jgi:hypothetical protein